MRSPPGRRPSRGRRSSARRAARIPVPPRSRRWPSAITTTARSGRLARLRPGRARNDRTHHRRDHRNHRDRAGAQAPQDRDHPRACRRHRDARAEQVRDQTPEMTIVAIIIALVLAFLAFRFVTGMIKFGVIALIAIIALLFLWKGGGF